jgi:hypothetical protein
MGRCVGALRDADVLISGIHAPVAATSSDKAGFAELLETLTRERQRRRDEVRATLRGPAWTKLQLYLTLWPRTLAENPNFRCAGFRVACYSDFMLASQPYSDAPTLIPKSPQEPKWDSRRPWGWSCSECKCCRPREATS